MIGTIIKEQFQIVELIGEGGMGVVYKALDLELERYVALKLLKSELADNHVLIQRFRDELRTLAGFNHPNITTLFTSVTWQEHPVMVMELVEGETLQKLVDRRGPIPANVCVPLLHQALAGVGSAHRKKIIHRDLKPANLMLNNDGVVKVMDFGIAKIQSGHSLTRSNVPIGTSLYMAPEQILGQTADARTDIYAMGVTLYELLAGRVPFLGDSQYAIEHAHMQQMPDPPTVHYPHIPVTVVDAVMKSLAKDPAQRFQSAEEFAAALGDGRSAVAPSTVQAPSPPVKTPPPAAWNVTPPPHPAPAFVTEPPPPRVEPEQRIAVPTPPPRKSAVGIAAAGLAAVLLLTVGGFWMHSLSKPSPKDEYSLASTPSSGGSGNESDAKSRTVAPSPAARETEPFVITPLKPSPGTTVAPREDSTKREIAQIPPRTTAEETIQQRDGVVGQWTGTYDRCEDGGSTNVTVKLSEPSPGLLSGSLRYTTPDGGSGRCTLDGVVLGRGTKVSLKASVCVGAMPPYLSAGHESLLTFTGNELSGSVEPQEPCMTISLRKNGN